jgi:hypothetical protein
MWVEALQTFDPYFCDPSVKARYGAIRAVYEQIWRVGKVLRFGVKNSLGYTNLSLIFLT